MPLSLLYGLLLALFGLPLLQLAFNKLGVDALSPAIRICLWLLCLGVLVIAAHGSASWIAQLNLHQPSAKAFVGAGIATVIVLAAWPIIQRAQLSLASTPIAHTAQFRKILGLSVSHRLFIAITAGVVEEVLYRGYAIGIGGVILGSQWLAASLSLAVFVGAHFRWGLSHLLSVFWAGLVLCALFIFTQDLIACIVAHTAIDVVGILIAPAILAKREARRLNALQRDD